MLIKEFVMTLIIDILIDDAFIFAASHSRNTLTEFVFGVFRKS